MEFAPRAEVTRLSGGIACSADGTCSTHRDNVFREVVQAAADWCLSHARGNVSKEAGGRLFNARLFHARGERLHLFDAFLCTWRLVKQSRGALLRTMAFPCMGRPQRCAFPVLPGTFPV